MAMTIEFPHSPPEGYSYEQREFKRNIIGIWINFNRHFVYNHGDRVSCIWGFYNTKTRKYYAPINAKTVGKQVDIERTTPYSAMPIKQTPLESAFV